MAVTLGNIIPRVKLAIEGKTTVSREGKRVRLDPVTHVGGVDVIPLIKAARDMGLEVPIDCQPDPARPNQYASGPVSRLILTVEEGVRNILDQQRKNSGSCPKNLEPYKWKPGQSGNPSGRPKGRTVTDCLRQLVEANDGKQLAERLAKVIVDEALKGDHRFVKELSVLKIIPPKHARIARMAR